MSNGPRWSTSFSIEAALHWKPYLQFDNESNYGVVIMGWLCFRVSAEWFK